MAAHLVSLPMYHTAPAALEAFWHGLQRHMAEHDIADIPAVLIEPDDFASHWTGADILLSQTCGYPFSTFLAGKVRYVGTPRYTAPGCEGASYRSFVIVRADDPAQSLEDLRDWRVAYNSTDSQSGYNTLRALIAPLARRGRFFSARLETGGHHNSMGAVRSGKADTAAIDCVTYAMAQRHRPDEVAGLRVLCPTALAPGLPLITSLAAGSRTIEALRAAFTAACMDETLAEARNALFLGGLEVLSEDEYAALPQWREQAAMQGYPELA